MFSNQFKVPDLGWSVLSFMRRIEDDGTNKDERHNSGVGRLFKFVRGIPARPPLTHKAGDQGIESKPCPTVGNGAVPAPLGNTVRRTGSGTDYSLTDCGPVSGNPVEPGGCTDTSVTTKRARPTGKKPYRLHLIWQHGKEDELWVELGAFYYLKSCYQRMTKMRVNLARYRANDAYEKMRVPILCIEFTNSKMVRTFKLVPELDMSVRRISSEIYTGRPVPMVTSWYLPKSWLLDPMKKLKKGKKKKKKPKMKPSEMRYSG